MKARDLPPLSLLSPSSFLQSGNCLIIGLVTYSGRLFIFNPHKIFHTSNSLSITHHDFELKCLNKSDKLKVLNESLIPCHSERVLLTRQSPSPHLVIVASADHDQVAAFSHSCQGRQGLNKELILRNMQYNALILT